MKAWYINLIFRLPALWDMEASSRSSVMQAALILFLKSSMVKATFSSIWLSDKLCHPESVPAVKQSCQFKECAADCQHQLSEPPNLPESFLCRATLSSLLHEGSLGTEVFCVFPHVTPLRKKAECLHSQRTCVKKDHRNIGEKGAKACKSCVIFCRSTKEEWKKKTWRKGRD